MRVMLQQIEDINKKICYKKEPNGNSVLKSIITDGVHLSRQKTDLKIDALKEPNLRNRKKNKLKKSTEFK